jgi:large subunit ribosomal protein L5
MIPRLKEHYQKKLQTELKTKLGLDNIYAVPKLHKVVINIGLGRATQDSKIINLATEELTKIVGQKPVVSKSKKAISNFKLRKGQAIGCMVTLRQNHMYEFVDRLVNIALPRVKDFKGISRKAFDEAGNYTLGLREHTIFPEIQVDKADQQVFGMNVTFVTNAGNKQHALELLSGLGMPFREAK